MPTRIRRVFIALAAVLLVAYAYQALWTAAPIGRDWSVLVEAGRNARDPERSGPSAWFAPLEALDARGAHPLAAVSINLGVRLWGDGGRDPLAAVRPLRLGNLALLVAAGAALAAFLRRLLLPWTGSDQATAAGWSAGFFLVLHPLLFPLVARVSGRGDLLALAFSMASAAFFLRGRQEFVYRDLVLAAGCAVLAGLSSELALGLCFVLAFAEYASARRYRPRHVRARTAATTFCVFGAAVALQFLAGVLRTGHAEAPPPIAELGQLASTERLSVLVPTALEKLGLLVLPVNGAALGLFGQGIAAALILVALQPGLLAARTAPRLWSVLLAVWAGALFAALAFHPATYVSSRDLARSQVLVLGALAMCAGLGTVSTALSGLPRLVVPAIFAIGSALLAHGNALPWERASQAVATLRGELVAARVTWGRDAQLLVVDPPGPVLGVDALEDAIPWLADGALEGAPESPAETGQFAVRGIARAAIPAFARSERFRELRKGTLVFLVAREEPAPDKPFAGFESRAAREVPKPAPTSGSRTWYRDSRSPTLDLDPPANLALRVRGLADAETAKTPRMGWRSKGEIEHEATHAGVWVSAGAEPLAVFDLATSLEWLCSERVSRIWSAEGWSGMVEAEVLDDLPLLQVAEDTPLVPRSEGGDWLCEAPTAPASLREGARARFELALFDSTALELERFVCDVAPGGSLIARGAAQRARERARRGATLDWSLEWIVEGTPAARCGGPVNAQGEPRPPR